MIRTRFAVHGHSPKQAAKRLPLLLEGFSRRILLGAACFLASLLIISCGPATELPASAEEALLAYWAGLPSAPGLGHQILQAWPGVPPPAGMLEGASEMEIWCVEAQISAPEDPAVDGEKLIWIVMRQNQNDGWTAAMLATMSSLWPYEACGQAP